MTKQKYLLTAKAFGYKGKCYRWQLIFGILGIRFRKINGGLKLQIGVNLSFDEEMKIYIKNYLINSLLTIKKPDDECLM